MSIPSSSTKLHQGFPLMSLADECIKCYGLETCKILDDDAAGKYFALATVYPSKKVYLGTVLLLTFMFCHFIHFVPWKAI